MQLIEQMEVRLADEESLFRQQLLKEDIARLRKLEGLAAAAASIDDFKKEGLFIGWTQSDMRTHQIRPAVEAFLDAFHAWATSSRSTADEAALQSAWQTFDQERMEKLVRCL